MAEVQGVLLYAISLSEYGKFLGRGLAENFAAFDQALQLQIINTLEKDSEFSREFVRALPASLDYMSAESRKKIEELMNRSPHLGAKRG